MLVCLILLHPKPLDSILPILPQGVEFQGMTGNANVKVSKASAVEEALPDSSQIMQSESAQSFSLGHSTSQSKIAATSRIQPTIGCRGLKQHHWFPWVEGSEHGNWLVWGVNLRRDLPSTSIE